MNRLSYRVARLEGIGSGEGNFTIAWADGTAIVRVVNGRWLIPAGPETSETKGNANARA